MQTRAPVHSRRRILRATLRGVILHTAARCARDSAFQCAAARTRRLRLGGAVKVMRRNAEAASLQQAAADGVRRTRLGVSIAAWLATCRHSARRLQSHSLYEQGAGWAAERALGRALCLWRERLHEQATHRMRASPSDAPLTSLRLHRAMVAWNVHRAASGARRRAAVCGRAAGECRGLGAALLRLRQAAAFGARAATARATSEWRTLHRACGCLREAARRDALHEQVRAEPGQPPCQPSPLFLTSLHASGRASTRLSSSPPVSPRLPSCPLFLPRLVHSTHLALDGRGPPPRPAPRRASSI